MSHAHSRFAVTLERSCSPALCLTILLCHLGEREKLQLDKRFPVLLLEAMILALPRATKQFYSSMVNFCTRSPNFRAAKWTFLIFASEILVCAIISPMTWEYGVALTRRCGEAFRALEIAAKMHEHHAWANYVGRQFSYWVLEKNQADPIHCFLMETGFVVGHSIKGSVRVKICAILFIGYKNIN